VEQTRLTVGAALLLEQIEPVKDWLLEEQRDLEIRDFHEYGIADSWEPIVEKAKQILDGYTGRLGIHGPDPCITFIPTDSAIVELVQRRFMQALEACEELGATHMVIHSPFIFNGNPFLPHQDRMGHDDWFERAHRTLDEIVPIAERIGCTLVIENVWDKSPGLLLDLIRSFDSEQVLLCFDVGHAYIAHVNGGPPPDYWIREAGALLKNVHLHDTDGYYDRHWPPGMGQVNWEAVFTELNNLGLIPRLIFECPGKHYQAVTRWFREMGWAK
jgi:sugar phosphate isomerase/epimerase